MMLVDTSAWIEWLIGEEKADQVIAFTEICIVADLDTGLVLLAADLCARHKLTTADATIYATAATHDAELLIWDRHFEGLTGVRFVPKSTG